MNIRWRVKIMRRWAAEGYWRLCTWLRLPFWLWYRDGILTLEDLGLDNFGISAEAVRRKIDALRGKR